MSQINADTISNQAGTGPTNFPNGTNIASVPVFAGDPQNLIINGAFDFWQRGTSSTASGYVGTSTVVAIGTTSAVQHTTGAGISSTWAASVVISGSISINLMDATTNTWIMTGVFGRADAAISHIIGYTKSLSETLTQLRLTVGANSFDAGTAAISWG